MTHKEIEEQDYSDQDRFRHKFGSKSGWEYASQSVRFYDWLDEAMGSRDFGVKNASRRLNLMDKYLELNYGVAHAYFKEYVAMWNGTCDLMANRACMHALEFIREHYGE